MFAKYSAQLFDIESPYSLRKTSELVVDAIRMVTAQRGTHGLILMDYQPTPPMMADIYLSTVEHRRVVITAGNRVETFWQVLIDMSPREGGGVIGTVKLDRPRNRIKRWYGNVIDLQGLPRVLAGDCSIKIHNQVIG